MIPLYTQTEFDEAKSRDLLLLECEQCHSPFSLPKNVVQKSKLGIGGNKARFCRHSCWATNRTKELITLYCTQCEVSFQREPRFAKSGNVFCSRSCSATYNNLHKKHGTRRSKLEKWLEEQLTTLYPNLEFHFNRKDAINSELDIFIPSLMLAFELNGIYHYEPIHGQDKLNAIQGNDHRKFAACHETGISLCSIDTSTMKKFKEWRAMKFLEIIQDIIEARLSDSQPSRGMFTAETT